MQVMMLHLKTGPDCLFGFSAVEMLLIVNLVDNWPLNYFEIQIII